MKISNDILKWIIAVSSGLILGLLILGFNGLLTTKGSRSVVPGDLDGRWEASGNVDMEAVVDGEDFEVYIILDDVRSLYWKGDFRIPENNGTFILTSNADVDALSMSIFGSTLDEKNFGYENGAIAFDFDMMGIRALVELERVSDG